MAKTIKPADGAENKETDKVAPEEAIYHGHFFTSQGIGMEFHEAPPVTDTDLLKKIQELQHANFSLGVANTALVDENAALKQRHTYDPEITTLVNTVGINQLLAQHGLYKIEIATMVNVFQMFAGLFDPDASMISQIATIPKLLKDPHLKEQIRAITPIIEKYTAKTTENNE